MNIVGKGSYFYKTRRKYISSGFAFRGIFSKFCFLPYQSYKLSLNQRKRRIKGGMKHFKKYIPLIMDRFIMEYNLPCSSLLSRFSLTNAATTKLNSVSLFSSLSLAILSSISLLSRVIFSGASQLWSSHRYFFSYTSYMKWSFFYVKRQLRLKFYDSLLFTLQNLRSRVAYILMKSKRTNQYLLFSYLNKIIYGKSMGQLVQSKKEKKRKQHNYLHGLDMSLAIARNRKLLPFNNIEIRLNTSLQSYNSLLAGFRKIYKHLWVNYYYFLIGYRRWLDRVYRYLQKQSLATHRRLRRRYWLNFHKYYKQVVWNKYYKPQMLKIVNSRTDLLEHKNEILNSLRPLEFQSPASRMKVLRLLLLRYLKWKKRLSRRRLFSLSKLLSRRVTYRYLKTKTGLKKFKLLKKKTRSPKKKDVDILELIKQVERDAVKSYSRRRARGKNKRYSARMSKKYFSPLRLRNKKSRKKLRYFNFFVSKYKKGLKKSKKFKLRKRQLVRFKSRWRIKKVSSLRGKVGWLQKWKFFFRRIKPSSVKYFFGRRKEWSSRKTGKYIRFVKGVRRRVLSWFRRQTAYNRNRALNQSWFREIFTRNFNRAYKSYPKNLVRMIFPYGKKPFKRTRYPYRHSSSLRHIIRRSVRLKKSEFKYLIKKMRFSNPRKKMNLRRFLVWYLPRIRSASLVSSPMLSKISSGYFCFRKSWYRFFRELRLHNKEDLRNFLIRSERKKYLKFRDRKWKNWYYYTQKINYFGDLLMSVTGIADYTSVSHSGVGWRARRVMY